MSEQKKEGSFLSIFLVFVITMIILAAILVMLANLSSKPVYANSDFRDILRNYKDIKEFILPYSESTYDYKSDFSVSGQFGVTGPYWITVSDKNTFEVNIADAKFTWREDAVNEENYPILESDAGTKEVFIFGREGSVSYNMIQAEMARCRLRPATVQEVVEFVKTYPQRPGTEIIALGQRWSGRGGFWYVRCRVSLSGTAIDTVSWEPRYLMCGVEFLAVRSRNWR